MWRPSFEKTDAQLVGFLGDIPINIVRAHPVYRFGQRYVIGIASSLSVLEGRNSCWLDEMIRRGSMTRLEIEGQPPFTMCEQVSVIVVSDAGITRLTDAIPGWQIRFDYRPVEGQTAIWVSLPHDEADRYLGGLVHRMIEKMDVLLQTATGDGTVERRVEAMGWAIWEGLFPSDEKHRRQIMVRIVAARRMRIDVTPAQIETFRRIAAKSIFLSVKDEVKRRGFGPEEQLRKLDELVDRYVERLQGMSNEP